MLVYKMETVKLFRNIFLDKIGNIYLCTLMNNENVGLSNNKLKMHTFASHTIAKQLSETFILDFVVIFNKDDYLNFSLAEII